MSQASSTGKDGDQFLPYQIAVPSAAPGPRVRIRPVVAGDWPALAEMLARCSDQTHERRFHKYVRFFPEPYLAEALAGRAAHSSLLARLARLWWRWRGASPQAVAAPNWPSWSRTPGSAWAPAPGC